ncbi:kinase-like protein, partial [Trichoderma longibrachiatum ATCC 18648]
MPLRLKPGYPHSSSSHHFFGSSSSAHRSYTDGRDQSAGYQPKARVTERYRIIGFISSGTYGRVYKAVGRTVNGEGIAVVKTSSGFTPTSGSGSSSGSNAPIEVAIKKFKPDKEGEQVSYTGISQSAIREMSLCSELRHANVIRLVEIMLEDKCIFMVFEYAEHDLLQIIHHHT